MSTIKYIKPILLFFFFISFKLIAGTELSLNTESSFKASYENRFSFLFGINPSITKAQDLLNLSFFYGRKMENFWGEFGFLTTNGQFNKLTTNNPSATTLTNADSDLNKSTLATIALGLGIETQLVSKLISYESLYEFSAADLTYTILKNETGEKLFTGPGIIARFSLFKKFSEAISFGTQFIYNLSLVQRSANDSSETISARSLTMSHLTVGIDLTFYQ